MIIYNETFSFISKLITIFISILINYYKICIQHYLMNVIFFLTMKGLHYNNFKSMVPMTI